MPHSTGFRSRVLALAAVSAVVMSVLLPPALAERRLSRALKFVGPLEAVPPNKRSWGPEQVEGPPDVPQAGDNVLAWASQSQDGQQEWLVCEYAQPVNLRAVVVHASYNPGALVSVIVYDTKGEEVVAWDGEDPTPRSKPRGVSVLPVKLKFPVQKIKLTLDSQAVPGWNEIDAVGLEDREGTIRWATKVEASTTYAARGTPVPGNTKPSYAPDQAAGPPDTFRAGDQGTAWASAAPDGQAEWLVCHYETAQQPAEIVVYENNAPGAISKVSVFDADGKEHVVWEGADPTPRNQPWGISVFPVKSEFPFKTLKLYLNSGDVPGYNEVDAVGLRAVNGDTLWASRVEASSAYGQAAYLDAMPAESVPERTQPAVSADLQKELQALRDQVQELQKVRDELKELKALLKDKLK